MPPTRQVSNATADARGERANGHSACTALQRLPFFMFACPWLKFCVCAARVLRCVLCGSHGDLYVPRDGVSAAMVAAAAYSAQ